MIYELLYGFRHFTGLGWLNVLRYPSFRAIMSAITAMVVSFMVAPWFIQKLRGKQISQIIREEGPASHHAKKGTPTMGGALILLSVLVPTVLWADVKNVFVVATTSVTAGYGLVGYIDDRLKIQEKSSRGLPGRYKLVGQFAIGGLALAYLFFHASDLPPQWLELRGRLAVPFLAFDKHPIELPLLLYVFLALVFVVFTSNAVNLTDGLDGLAIGPSSSTRARTRSGRTSPAPCSSVGRSPTTSTWRASRRWSSSPFTARRWSEPASASSGTTRTPRRSSWATWARSRSAAASGCWPCSPRPSS